MGFTRGKSRKANLEAFCVVALAAIAKANVSTKLGMQYIQSEFQHRMRPLNEERL